MLLNILKTTLKRWAIAYFIAIILASIIILTIFRDASYPTGQIAVAIVIPIFVIIAGVRIVKYFSSEKKQRRQRNTTEEKQIELPPKWLQIASVFTLLLFIGSFLISIMFLISSAIYSLLGLDWASGVAYHNITIPSFIVAGASFTCLLIIIFAFIITPYWPRIIRIIQKRFAIWSGMTKEIRINGYKLPIHR